jgi:uncharacterized repeat protein (TIGR02543 family)
MDANKSITATFALDTHTLSVNTVGSGSVVKNPDLAAYDYGTSVQLTAAADIGYTFTGWSGDASGTTNPLSVLVDGDKSITATFTLDTHTVSINTVGSGSVAKNPDLAAYDYGTSVDLTATADVGYTFAGWSGDASGTANPLTVLVDGDKNITATFTLDAYTLTVHTVGGGTVSRDPDQPTYPYGTTVALTPDRSGGFLFSGWSGDASGAANPLTLLMDGDKDLTATFTSNGQLPASNVGLGQGCYTLSNSFYQYFATPGAASAALSGQSITLTPVGSSYAVSYGGGTYLPPSGLAATILIGVDDGQMAIAPSVNVPYPGGSAASLWVHSNGIVAAGPITMPDVPNSHTPNVDDFLGETAAAWFSWHNLDVTEGGAIRWEEVAGVLYVTWQGVESHPGAPTTNPSTFQFQFDLNAGPTLGVVKYVWDTIASIGTGQSTGRAEQTLIGWSPGGASLDAGSIDLATATPFSTWAVEVQPLALSASPTPVSTPTTGTPVTYTVTNIPETFSGSGIRLAGLFFSFAPATGGVDLGMALDAPGCRVYLQTLDASIGVGPSTLVTQTADLTFPPGVPYGLTLVAQALAVFDAGTLPNGQNPGGLITSNAVVHFVSDY